MLSCTASLISIFQISLTEMLISMNKVTKIHNFVSFSASSFIEARHFKGCCLCYVNQSSLKLSIYKCVIISITVRAYRALPYTKLKFMLCALCDIYHLFSERVTIVPLFSKPGNKIWHLNSQILEKKIISGLWARRHFKFFNFFCYEIAAKFGGSIGILPCCVLNDFFTREASRSHHTLYMVPTYIMYNIFPCWLKQKMCHHTDFEADLWPETGNFIFGFI